MYSWQAADDISKRYGVSCHKHGYITRLAWQITYTKALGSAIIGYEREKRGGKID